MVVDAVPADEGIMMIVSQRLEIHRGIRVAKFDELGSNEHQGSSKFHEDVYKAGSRYN